MLAEVLGAALLEAGVLEAALELEEVPEFIPQAARLNATAAELSPRAVDFIVCFDIIWITP
ncbi:MAG: hypothetical protein LBE25_04570 [Arthrobacter sp.]|jgi:hypothetical protein|nr:hypothetical protein [Arthrobacter sp.]